MTSPATKNVWPSAIRYQGRRWVGLCSRAAIRITTGEESPIRLKSGPTRIACTNRYARVVTTPSARYTTQARCFIPVISATPGNALGRAPAAGHRTSLEHQLPVPFVLELEAIVDLPQHLAEEIDLLVTIGCRDLDPEPDLVFRDQGIGCHRHVDAPVEQVSADDVDVLVARQGDLDQGIPGSVRGVDVELTQPVQHPLRPLEDLVPDQVAPLLVDRQSGQRGGQRSRWRRSGEEVGGSGDLQDVLQPCREREEGEER